MAAQSNIALLDFRVNQNPRHFRIRHSKKNFSFCAERQGVSTICYLNKVMIFASFRINPTPTLCQTSNRHIIPCTSKKPSGINGKQTWPKTFFLLSNESEDHKCGRKHWMEAPFKESRLQLTYLSVFKVPAIYAGIGWIHVWEVLRYTVLVEVMKQTLLLQHKVNEEEER